QEKIMLLIPGFHGYKEREIRRESDKLLRNQIYQKLSSAEAHAKDTYRSLANQGINDTWDDTDHLMARLDRVVERINHSEYEYSSNATRDRVAGRMPRRHRLEIPSRRSHRRCTGSRSRV